MNLMKWDECEREFIRKVTPDSEKIDSIIETAVKRKKFIESQEANKENVSFIIEGYYEIIKEMLVAFLLKNGLKSGNHQCLFSYFYKVNPEFDFEVNLMLEMSYLRNRLDYYGEEIDISFYDKNKKDIQNTIKLLLDILKK
jgi:hypothetical protein